MNEAYFASGCRCSFCSEGIFLIEFSTVSEVRAEENLWLGRWQFTVVGVHWFMMDEPNSLPVDVEHEVFFGDPRLFFVFRVFKHLYRPPLYHVFQINNFNSLRRHLLPDNGKHVRLYTSQRTRHNFSNKNVTQSKAPIYWWKELCLSVLSWRVLLTMLS